MQTKLFILQQVNVATDDSKPIGVFSFIEDAIEYVRKTNCTYQHIKYEIFETVLGSGVVQLVDTKVKYNSIPEVIHI